MPCSDGGPSHEEIEFELKRQRGLAVGLCVACSELAALGKLPPSLVHWFDAHKAADAARDAIESAKKDVRDAETHAKRLGFELSVSHPLKQNLQQAWHVKRITERAEREASAALCDLRPAPHVEGGRDE